MTPYEQFIEDNKDSKDHKGGPKFPPTENWDWNAQLPMWDWHTVSIDMYRNGPMPGWDRIGDETPFVMFEHTDADKSRSLAQELDDVVAGLFYYRDWTGSGIPCVGKEETYWSGFWFQKLADAMSFHAAAGGIASWEPGFEEKQKAMNNRRNGNEES